MQFTLQFDCDNAAFYEDGLDSEMRDITDRLLQDITDVGDLNEAKQAFDEAWADGEDLEYTGTVKDSYGNTIGYWRLGT